MQTSKLALFLTAAWAYRGGLSPSSPPLKSPLPACTPKLLPSHMRRSDMLAKLWTSHLLTPMMGPSPSWFPLRVIPETTISRHALDTKDSSLTPTRGLSRLVWPILISACSTENVSEVLRCVRFEIRVSASANLMILGFQCLSGKTKEQWK